VLVLIVIAAVAVVAAVVFVAMGYGGGLSAERNDYLPIDLGPVSATDVALLRPPTGLWGYNMQATDEALELIAESIRERDVRIVALEQLVTDLSRRDHAPIQVLGSPYAGARHRRELSVESGAVGTATEPARPPVTAEREAVPAPAGFGPAEPGWPPAAEETGWPPPAASSAEPAPVPFEPPKPSGDVSGAPPEESHD
jgi:hypothetical protein